MDSSDSDVVQQLWSARFGGDPATQETWIDAALDPGHTAAATVAVPSEGESVVGFGVLEVGGPAYTRRYLSLDALGLDPPLDDRNGLFHMYCVHADWGGRGIGSALFAHHLERLAEREVACAFGLAWHRPHTVDSRLLFERHGFGCLAAVERYYARFEERPHCPDCDGLCSCAASVYARSVESR
jgi:ribosomal protein S18 acetylase RimI-like enzyme